MSENNLKNVKKKRKMG